jgi:hypothetical protein
MWVIDETNRTRPLEVSPSPQSHQRQQFDKRMNVHYVPACTSLGHLDFQHTPQVAALTQGSFRVVSLTACNGQESFRCTQAESFCWSLFFSSPTVW